MEKAREEYFHPAHQVKLTLTSLSVFCIVGPSPAERIDHLCAGISSQQVSVRALALREGATWGPASRTAAAGILTTIPFLFRALGMGGTRGRIYIKHPHLFKVGELWEAGRRCGVCVRSSRWRREAWNKHSSRRQDFWVPVTPLPLTSLPFVIY